MLIKTILATENTGISFAIGLKFMGKLLLIFLIIYLLAELTPKLAKKIDSKKEKLPETQKYDEKTEIKSVFGADTPEDNKNNKK